MNLSKKIIAICSLMLLVLIGMAAMEPMKVKPFQRRPVNLKVLAKNISNDSLFNLMKIYEHALGVNCAFCHVEYDKDGREDYPNDARPAKEAARNMMRMTTAINKIYFNISDVEQSAGIQAVTCFTCHRGKKQPGLDSLLQR